MDHLRSKIRILVTHQLQFIKKADLILVLKDGKMVALQNYEELMNSGLNFVSLLHNEQKLKGKDIKLEVSDLLERKYSRSLSRLSSASEQSFDHDVEEIPHQPKIEEEGKVMGSVKGDVYWKYIKAGAGLCLFMSMVIASLVSQGLYQYCDVFLADWTNRGELRHAVVVEANNTFLNDSSSTNSTVSWAVNPVDEIFYVIVYSVLTIGLFVSTLIRTVVFFLMCMRASVNLHNTIFINVLRAPMAMFDNNPVGKQDVYTLRAVDD